MLTGSAAIGGLTGRSHDIEAHRTAEPFDATPREATGRRRRLAACPAPRNAPANSQDRLRLITGRRVVQIRSLPTVFGIVAPAQSAAIALATTAFFAALTDPPSF